MKRITKFSWWIFLISIALVGIARMWLVLLKDFHFI